MHVLARTLVNSRRWLLVHYRRLRVYYRVGEQR